MVTEHRFASPQTNVTKQNNQGRTKRYDCIPLPTKSLTACNPPVVQPHRAADIEPARYVAQGFATIDIAVTVVLPYQTADVIVA